MPESTTAIRTYKYLLKPTAGQQERLSQILHIACDLYNYALQHRKERWEESRCTVTYYEQAALLTGWRGEDIENNSLRTIGAVVGQQVLRRLDKAFRAFLKGQRGYPKFKRYRFFNSVNYPYGYGALLKGATLHLHNVGPVPIRWYRPLPGGRLKNVIVKRQGDSWWVSFQLEIPQHTPESHFNPPVGIDIGVHRALALSDGTVIDSPRFLKQSLNKLRRLQRMVSRRHQGSRRHWKAVKQVARLHERIANQRRDWWHKVTRWLVDSYSVIVLEELNLNFMLRNGSLSRPAHDVSLGMFRELLGYKAIEARVEIVTVSPAYTSQSCSACGVIVPKKLSERVHRCGHCGFMADRDVNAALNILSSARRQPSGANVEVVNSRVA